MSEHFDVVIVGAGLSGIGAAWHLQRHCPGRTYAILEGREALGGTWDLFRYPGIRSDSDMYTLGYHFRPWTDPKAIADGPSILRYVADTAREHGIDRHIRFGHRVKSADWSSTGSRWTVTAEVAGRTTSYTCNFLHLCAGYYDYEHGHAPVFAGTKEFGGRVVHPQFWPNDLDYTGKQVIVIGSGATAVTLVPEMAKQAARVTMLQRSPTFVVSRPAEDGIANWLRAKLPGKAAYGITRWKNVLLGMFFYQLARRRPERVKERMIGMVRDHLGPDYDVATHFTPRYNPWDQRVCLVPDADLFDSIKAGKAAVVTGAIERFDTTGIVLTDGRRIDADIVVTATGLEVKLFGGLTLSLDGRPIDPAKSLIYRGMMLSDVPNLAFTFGYTNASWTLKADLVSRYLCRLLNEMQRRGALAATPRVDRARVSEADFVSFSSGYIQRAADRVPKQGDRKPWRLNQNYALDIVALKYGSVTTGMEFSGADAGKERIAA